MPLLVLLALILRPTLSRNRLNFETLDDISSFDGLSLGDKSLAVDNPESQTTGTI